MFLEVLRKIFTEDEIQEIYRAAEERHVHPHTLIRQAVVQDLYR